MIQMRLTELLEGVLDGDELGWDAEFELLRTTHAPKLRELFGSVLREGIRTPILIGPDNRVWDGHHRLYVAYALGFVYVPVEYARPKEGT